MSDCTVGQIKEAVCAEFNVPLIEMTSHVRARRVARPRQVAIYLTRQLTKMKMSAIAFDFGKQDHTTIVHAVQRILALMAADSEFALRVTAIEARLTATQQGEHY